MAPQASLTSDIQRALRNAISQPKDSLHQSHEDANPKKRKHEVGKHGPGDVKERKKRSKRVSAEQPQAEPTIQAPESTADSALSTPPSIGLPPGTTGKKKRKEKGKKRTEDAPAQDKSLLNPGDMQAHAYTAAFLSALVAAASANNLESSQSGESHSPLGFSNAAVPQYPEQSPHYFPSGTEPFQYPSLANSADQATLFFHGTQSLSELTSSANEEILRSVQDVDMSKLQSVLKTLGEAAASAQLSQNTFIPSHGQPPQHLPQPPPVNQNPAPSYAILGKQPKNVEPPRIPVREQYGNHAHAEMLATKWMNAGKLAEMVKSEGLVFHKGKFSDIEQSQIGNALDGYRIRNGLSLEQLNEIIFAKDKAKDKEFWSEITCAVPLRPIIAVYHYVRRAYHPLKGQGKWTSAQDDLLEQAIVDCGQQWEKVSERVGRMASDCRDRYRNHLADRQKRRAGVWSKEEEEELTAIVTEMTTDKGKDVDNDIFWGVVSQRMGNKRGRQQCRIKWIDSLSKALKNEGEKPRWTAQDAYILVHKIDSLNVRHDSEIDWKTLLDPDWNLWSPHILQRRWTTMKRGIKGHENMSHHDIVDILRLKKATNLPTFSVGTSNRKKVKSSATVQDEDISDHHVEELRGSPSIGTGAQVKNTDHPEASASSGSDPESSSDED